MAGISRAHAPVVTVHGQAHVLSHVSGTRAAARAADTSAAPAQRFEAMVARADFENYYAAKWGGSVGSEKHELPFGVESATLASWHTDLTRLDCIRDVTSDFDPGRGSCGPYDRHVFAGWKETK